MVKWWSLPAAILLLTLGLVGCGADSDSTGRKTLQSMEPGSEEALVAALRELNAEVLVEESVKGEKIVSVDLSLVDQTSAALELVVHLPRVDRLSLHSSQATAADFRQIARLPALRYLDVSQTAIADDDLRQVAASLPDLEFLLLWSTAIGDPSLASIGKLQRLRKLDLSHTRVTAAGLSQLMDLQRLEELLLELPSLKDDDLRPLRARLKGTSIEH